LSWHNEGRPSKTSTLFAGDGHTYPVPNLISFRPFFQFDIAPKAR
jgi:hypothetical protein